MKHKIVVGLFLVLGLALCVPPSAPAGAIDASDLNSTTDCQSNAKGIFNGAILGLPGDTYDIYVKLAKRGQNASVKVAAQSTATEPQVCQPLGATDASGDKWVKVGSWEQEQDVYTIFEVSSDQLGTALDANRPSLMLVPQQNAPCIPDVECTVKVGDETGSVMPPGSLSSTNSLHIVRVVNPARDNITKVVYYVDGSPAYTVQSLEPFDLRYVTHNNQKLTRVIEYESGQRVVIESAPPEGSQDSFFNFIFRIGQNNPRAFVVLGWAAGLSILAGIASLIWRAVRRRHEWRIAHGFIQTQAKVVTSADVNQAFARNHTKAIIKNVVIIVLGVGAIIAGIILANLYVFTIFRVDGQSMQSTYFTGNQMLVNKIPVTWARMSGLQYVPKRGEVVILQPVYGVVDPTISELETSHIIKRIIGLPGERVLIKDGKVTIFNKENPSGFNPDEGVSWQETMHANDPSESLELTLSSDELFISGDNRPESVDSRFNGPISTRQITGVVTTKLW